MKIKQLVLFISALTLTACALTPEQRAVREAKRLRAEQALQVQLAQQCDAKTAELMHQQFNPPLTLRSESEQQAFEKRYMEKVENPMFQACCKLAWHNYKAQEEIRQMQYDYARDYGFWGWGRCYACW